MNTQLEGEMQMWAEMLTLVHIKQKNLEQNKPRPSNYYEIEEKLQNEFNLFQDRLTECIIKANTQAVMEKLFTGSSKTTQQTENQQ